MDSAGYNTHSDYVIYLGFCTAKIITRTRLNVTLYAIVCIVCNMSPFLLVSKSRFQSRLCSGYGGCNPTDATSL